MPKKTEINSNYVLKRAKEIFQGVVDKYSFLLWDIELTHIADDYTLTLFLDKDGGIDLLDLERINPELNDVADKEDLIPFPYMFEVSSAGALRILKNEWHYKSALGHNVHIKFYKKQENIGTKEFDGKFLEFDEDTVEVIKDENKYRFNFSDISQIKAEF